jgi:type I restriction enzyme M protein
MANSFTELANLIWSVADLLRGDYKQSDYGKVILPFTLLRRLECVLEPTKAAVVAEYKKRKPTGVVLDPILKRKAGLAFYNVSPFTLEKVLADSKNIRVNLVAYVSDFSEDARDVFERFKFTERIAELDEKDLLFKVTQSFANVDLHPDVVPNDLMGLVFEELIRKFAELSNETAGEHFTPREVVRLIVQCLFAGDDEALSKPGVVRSMYDPTAGTGGILSVGESTAKSINASAIIRLFGQELNDESYAICKADMLIKGQDPANIKRGNTLSADGFAGMKFDYGAANPPFGVDWKKVKEFVEEEHKRRGYAGRFGPGLPRVSDGSMLFLLHLISKMRPKEEGGGRVGIVLNGSPLFTGDAGSGESEIRRWILDRCSMRASRAAREIGGNMGGYALANFSGKAFLGTRVVRFTTPASPTEINALPRPAFGSSGAHVRAQEDAPPKGAFHQPAAFFANSSVRALSWKSGQLSTALGLAPAAPLRPEMPKFSYDCALGLSRL